MSFGKSVLVGFALGTLWALFMCSAAIDHNPQGEFANLETGAYTSDLYILFAVWAVISGFCFSALLALIGFLWRAD